MACLDDCNCEFIVQFFDDNDQPQEIRITKDPGNGLKYNLHVLDRTELENDQQFTLANIVSGDHDDYPFTTTTRTRVWGFLVVGDPLPCDCVATMTIDGKFVGQAVLSADNRTGLFKLEKPIAATTGQIVNINVINTHPTLTASYKGIIYHEVINN